MNKVNCLLVPSYSLRRTVARRCSGRSHGFAASLVESEDAAELQTKYKPLERLPTKLPFVKNLFRGKFDTDFLAFPEFLPEARVQLLERNADVVRTLMREHADSARIDATAAVGDELLDKMRALKLFGLTAPRSQGGAEFTHTERARIMEVVGGGDPSVGVLLFQHETLGHRLIAAYGDDRLKRRYLRPLIAGRKYATLCLGENECGSDAVKFRTYAVRSGTDWLLHGKKVWVTNADKADLFLVVAKVRLLRESVANPYYGEECEPDLAPEDVAIFLVERNAANVEVGPRVEAVGLRGASMCEVRFDNVVVPEGMVLTDFTRGYEVVKRILNEDRYAIGCVAAGVLKKALREVTEYSVRRKLHDTNLFRYEFAQRRLGRMLLSLYAMESLIYYTTGLMDMYQSQDCEVENAITKVFCTEAALNAVNDAVQLVAGEAVLQTSNLGRYHRDLVSLSLFDHHNDLHRSTIALNSMQYISTSVSEAIMVNRNPLFYSFKNIRNGFNLRSLRGDTDSPYLYLKLKDYLHPSLMYLADELEYCVLRFENAITKTLSHLGPDSVHDQMYVRRIADCAILLYSMVAVLSRASRSYCIGSEHADEELVLAETFVRESHDRFKELVAGLQFGEYSVSDHNFKRLSQKAVEQGGYFPPKPYFLNY